MPRSRAKINYNTFRSGQISDSNPLNPVADAARTLLNVDLNTNGKVAPRLGLAVEDGFNIPNLDGVYLFDDYQGSDYKDGHKLSELPDTEVSMAVWSNPGGSSDKSFRCIRVGHNLYIYDDNGDVLSDSLLKVFSIGGYSSSTGAGSSKTDLQMVSGKGFLICTGSLYQPFYVKYEPDDGSFLVEPVNIQIRDFNGYPVTSSLEDRPADADYTTEHAYNLENQGWSDENIATFRSEQGVYPSNVDSPVLGSTLDNNGNPVWRSGLVVDAIVGNTRAPRGHLIRYPMLSGFAAPGSSNYDIPGLDSLDRPRAVAFFAGRVFYGSVDGSVYYSQILNSEDDLQKCYQEQDPTAEEFNSLLDTDGGVLQVLDIGSVIKMVPSSNSLVLFGTKGISLISGGDRGFSANDQMLNRISDLSAISAESIVQVENSIVFWAEEGIYTIGGGQEGLAPKSLSMGKIQTDYSFIPAAAKANARGAYDKVARRIYWGYNTHTTDLENDIKHKCTHFLVFDVTLGAFFEYNLSNIGYHSQAIHYPMVSGLFNLPAKRTGEDNETLDSTLKLLMLIPGEGINDTPRYRPTFGQFSSREFQDWVGLSLDDIRDRFVADYGVADIRVINKGAYEKVVETLPLTLGEPSITKTLTYVTSHYDYRRNGFQAPEWKSEYGSGIGSPPANSSREADQVTEHALTITGKWDWTNDEGTGRWTRPQDAIKPRRFFIPTDPNRPYEDGFGVLRSKLKIRGHGEALVLRFEGERGKDFQLLGFTVSYTGLQRE